jgi:hypothetical protein
VSRSHQNNWGGFFGGGFYLVVIAMTFGALSCGDCVETPSVASIAPSNAVAGSSGLVLIVNGNHFRRDSVVNWNGTARVTTFVSGHQLNAAIGAGDLAAPALAEITVFSPPQSQPVTFGSNTASSTTSASMKADCVGGTSRALSFAVNP